MGVLETTVLYLLIGLVVAAALLLREEPGQGLAGRLALVGGALCFWPILAPGLLASRAPRREQPPVVASTALATRIAAAQEQLLSALGRMDGLAEEILAPEVARIRGLSGALHTMERRCSEMGALLATPEFDEARALALLAELGGRGRGDEDPRLQSVRARLKNIERLRAMERGTADELERVLLKLEELSSQLALLKFAGRPEAEVVRLIKELAESVSGITDGLLASS